MSKIVKITELLSHVNMQAMAERAFALKKISGWKSADDVQRDIIDVIFKYINLFNHLDKYDTRVLGLNFSDIVVPVEFADFLTPASIQYDVSDLECAELLAKEDVIVDEEYENDESYLLDNHLAYDVENVNYDEYINACSKFRGLFKDNLDNNVTTLEAIRKFVSWSEVSDRACYMLGDEDGGQVFVCRFNDGKPYFPIHAVHHLAYGWKARHFNAFVNELLDDYLEMWLIK